MRQACTEAHAAAEAATKERFAAALAQVRVEFNKQARIILLARSEAPAAARAAAMQHFTAAVKRTGHSKHARGCFARTPVGYTALTCFCMRETVSVAADMPGMQQHGAWTGGGALSALKFVLPRYTMPW